MAHTENTNPFEPIRPHLILDHERNRQEIARAYRTQNDQLDRWSKVLKKKVYFKLISRIRETEGGTVSDASQVVRGDKITNLLKLIKDGL